MFLSRAKGADGLSSIFDILRAAELYESGQRTAGKERRLADLVKRVEDAIDHCWLPFRM